MPLREQRGLADRSIKSVLEIQQPKSRTQFSLFSTLPCPSPKAALPYSNRTENGVQIRTTTLWTSFAESDLFIVVPLGQFPIECRKNSGIALVLRYLAL